MLNILVEILTILEGVQFRYCSSKHYIYQSMVYDDKEAVFKFPIEILKSFGRIIKLSESYFCFDSIRFYSISVDGNIVAEPSFPGYEYLTEFINRVVSYRFDNSVEVISDDQLERLKNEFLFEKLGEKKMF